jgi:hypothetical protein
MDRAEHCQARDVTFEFSLPPIAQAPRSSPSAAFDLALTHSIGPRRGVPLP